VVGLALAVSPVTAAARDLASYWREVGLKLSFVEPELSSAACYSEERHFLGCAAALQAILAQEEDDPPLVLVPRERFESERGYGEVAAVFGSLVVAVPPKLSSQGPLETYRRLRHARALETAWWRKLYSRRDSQPVPFEEILAWLKQSGRFTEQEPVLAAAALNRLLAITRDPHTVVLPAAWVRDEARSSGEAFTGIGIVLRATEVGGEPVILVDSVIDGGPAARAGIRPQDELVKVDGVAAGGQDLAIVSQRLEGHRGQPVTLTVRRKEGVVALTAIRDRIVVPNVTSGVLSTNRGVWGYVRIATFIKDSVCADTRGAISRLQDRGVQGLVLDLRDNPGGLVEQAVCVAGLFLNKGDSVVTTESFNAFGGSREYRVESDRVTALPLATLVNAHSASAAELVAGALQDNQRSWILGERTYGKGTVQGQSLLQNGKLVLRETVAKFYRPSGRSTQIEGVEPDLPVYRQPNPSALDLFARREEDEYGAFAPEGDGAWKQPRPGVVTAMQACIAAEGEAVGSYVEATQQGEAADYPRLVALDGLACAQRLGTGGADEPHPAWAARPFSFSWGRARDMWQSIWNRLNRAWDER
jgi:carboxyl-terminal processing protease